LDICCGQVLANALLIEITRRLLFNFSFLNLLLQSGRHANIMIESTRPNLKTDGGVIKTPFQAQALLNIHIGG
jgi:hypothetical protein